MTSRKKEFIEKAAPEYWFSYASELAEAADGIYERSKRQYIAYVYCDTDGSKDATRRPFASRPVLLLYGLSLENLIKALLISEDPTLLKDGKLSKQLLGHDLGKLADRLKSIQLNGAERDLLSLLSDVVPYHGRYPVPRSAEDIKPEKYIDEDVYQALRALFHRLEMQLYRLNFEGLDAPDGVRFPNLRLTHLDAEADFITGEYGMNAHDLQREFEQTMRKKGNKYPPD